MNDSVKKKLLYLSAVLLSCSVIILLIPSGDIEYDLADDPNWKSKKQLTVIDVIDGDTYLLSDSAVIRLIGVDTPEKGQAYYREAINFINDLLLNKPVRPEKDIEPEDRYGRKLVYLFCDSIFVNKIILENGLGILYLFENNQKHKDTFLNAQNRARREKTGIWSLPPPPGEDYYVKAKRSFRFHRPLCVSVKNINLSNFEIINTRNDALDKALSPCRNCLP